MDKLNGRGVSALFAIHTQKANKTRNRKNVRLCRKKIPRGLLTLLFLRFRAVPLPHGLSVGVGTHTVKCVSSSTDRTHSRISLCVLCYQYVTNITTALFIGTHTPHFECRCTDQTANFDRLTICRALQQRLDMKIIQVVLPFLAAVLAVVWPDIREWRKRRQAQKRAKANPLQPQLRSQPKQYRRIVYHIPWIDEWRHW